MAKDRKSSGRKVILERTLVFVKPDGLQRRCVGKIIQRFEEKGLKLIGLKMAQLPAETARAHYAEHRNEEFYESLVQFVRSGPVVLMAWEGPKAISVVRKLVGATSGLEAEPGTIRGDFGLSQRHNLIHASDSPESAERELGLFFSDDLVDWELADRPWIAHD